MSGSDDRHEKGPAAEALEEDKFPEGLRVLVVDDDPVFLRVLGFLLRVCKYKVTRVTDARTALEMLREGGEEKFDLVITDLHMPDMDGFKLLEIIGLNMDLPVIMLSVNGEKETVYKGILHGACDYLVKPVKIKELKNIWQHVARKNQVAMNHDSSESDDDADQRMVQPVTVVHGQGSAKKSNKRSKNKKNDRHGSYKNRRIPTTQKKPRVSWTGALHNRFIEAVNRLGVDQAVPKAILRMMNVKNLSRESVASHLQKFDLPAPFVLHTDCPHYWRFHLPGETEEEFATRLANNLENLILKEGPETIAAFIAEPVMGAGGVIPPPKTYFDKVQAVVKKYDILFIVDEVITAFGRLGTMFGSDMYNIKPDLVTLAKALSSAYVPIGATLVSPEIADVIDSQSNKLGSFAHGFTYSGHPVACAVAIEALKIYRERNIPDHVKQITPRFQEGLKAFAGSPIVGEIRGVGLILGTEFADNKSRDSPFPAEWGVGAIFGQECQKRGMLVRVAGDSIMMSPPLTMTPGKVDELVSIYREALKSMEEKVAALKSKKD